MEPDVSVAEHLEARLQAARIRFDETARYVQHAQQVGRIRRLEVRTARARRTEQLEAVRAATAARRRKRVGLTARQHEILRLVAEGLSTKQIARELWLSPATVRNHVSAILLTLDAHSRIEAVATARDAGLLDGHRAATATRLV
jgi:DNA-binding NarL/FixJ family response regulator